MKAVLAAVAALLVAACTQSFDGGAVANAQQALAPTCAANEILTSGSPFAQALATWSTEPVGSTRGVGELAFACEQAKSSTRGTELAACTLLGLLYASGAGVPRDAFKAFSYFRLAGRCDGFSFGATDLAQAEDHRITTHVVSCCGGHGCAAGCEDACARAREQVKNEVEPPLRAACRRGQGPACFMLARLVGGEHLARVGEVKIAAGRSDDHYYELACNLGVGLACAWPAARAPEDQPAVRRRWYERACASGWGDACLTLGQDLDAAGRRPQAIAYWEKACKLGLLGVCQDVGDILSKGDGVPEDHERAVKMYAEGWKLP